MALIESSKSDNEHATADKNDANMHYPKGFRSASHNTYLAKDYSGNPFYYKRQHLGNISTSADGMTTPPSEDYNYLISNDNTFSVLSVSAGTDTKYQFNTSDLSGVSVGDYFKVIGFANASNNGVFKITIVNDASDFIEVVNTSFIAETLTVTGEISLADWDGNFNNYIVQFNSTLNLWYGEELTNGQMFYNETNKLNYVFENQTIRPIGGGGYSLKFTIDYTDFQPDIDNFNSFIFDLLPKGHVVNSYLIKPTTAFAGTSVTSAVVKLTQDSLEIIKNVDVFVAGVNDGAIGSFISSTSPNINISTNLSLDLTLGGGEVIDNLTQGSFDITIKILDIN